MPPPSNSTASAIWRALPPGKPLPTTSVKSSASLSAATPRRYRRSRASMDLLCRRYQQSAYLLVGEGASRRGVRIRASPSRPWTSWGGWRSGSAGGDWSGHRSGQGSADCLGGTLWRRDVPDQLVDLQAAGLLRRLEQDQLASKRGHAVGFQGHVAPIDQEPASLDVVLRVGPEDFVQQSGSDRLVLDRKHHFDPAVEIPRHPISG